MGLGIVSDEDFKNELDNNCVDVIEPVNDIESSNIEQRPSDNTITSADILKMPTVGRTLDVSNIPQSLRKILAEEVVTNGLASAKNLANSFGGISQPTLSTFARGEVSPNGTNTQDKDLLTYVNNRKTKVSKRALNKLNLALALIDEDKLNNCEARELSSVAKDMAQIVKHMEPSDKNDAPKDPVQFHFYAPQVRTENHYDVVQAKDNY